MGEEIRKVVFDEELEIEAYKFEGVMQKFPNHFHEHYVIGFIEKGNRHLIEYFLKKYTEKVEENNVQISIHIKESCDYMDRNYRNQITLEDLCNVSGLKKYTLLRNFTKQCGVTPYQYLETVRINHAKRLLEYGVEPIEAAVQTGFSDQSHFSRFFKSFIGITPKQYQIIFKEEENEYESK